MLCWVRDAPCITHSWPCTSVNGRHHLCGLVQAVCAYIVRQKLQDPAQPGTVRCDARLKAVLGEAALPMSGIAERLAKHLSPPPPVEMTYAIKCAPQHVPPYAVGGSHSACAQRRPSLWWRSSAS